MNIIITANSPGELYGWARPLARRLKETGNNIILVLLPCVFSSGQEKRVAAKMPFIDGVVTGKEYLYLMFLYKKLKVFEKFPPHIIVHLGGDLFHSALMAGRFNIKALAYKWANKTWDSYFSKYFVPQKKFKDIMLKQGIGEEKVEVIGELVADAVLDELKHEKEDEDFLCGTPVICFMPGSRVHELRCLVKFFMKIAELISQKLPSSSFILSLSPFISMDVFLKILSSPVARGFSGSDAKLLEEGNIKYLETSSKVRVLLYQGGTGAIEKSDFVLTIPGTKSSEAAVLGKPMMVITPMNRPDLIPYCGFIGLLDLLPFGSYLKGKLILQLVKKFGFTALPNILAGREIVPEMNEFVTPEHVTAKILQLLKDKDKLHLMSEELKKLYSPGAADRAVKLILDAYEEKKI